MATTFPRWNLRRPVTRADTLPILSPRTAQARLARTSGMPPVAVHGATHRGRKRARNEDQFIVADLSRWISVRCSSVAKPSRDRQADGVGQGLLLAIADGMGGHAAGDLASAVALDTLLHHTCQQLAWVAPSGEAQPAILDGLAAAAYACDGRIREVADRKGLAERRPGTTMTAAYVLWPHAYLVHAGDSRAYLLRDGHPEQLTTDHSLTSDPANALSHVLLNCLGASERCQPETSIVELRPGDTLLLCTDGLTRHVPDDDIAALIGGAAPDVACAKLIDAANDAGGSDNITAVVARFEEP